MPLGLQDSPLVFAPATTTTTPAAASDYAPSLGPRDAAQTGRRLDSNSAGLAPSQIMTNEDVESEARPPYLHVRTTAPVLELSALT